MDYFQQEQVIKKVDEILLNPEYTTEMKEAIGHEIIERIGLIKRFIR